MAEKPEDKNKSDKKKPEAKKPPEGEKQLDPTKKNPVIQEKKESFHKKKTAFHIKSDQEKTKKDEIKKETNIDLDGAYPPDSEDAGGQKYLSERKDVQDTIEEKEKAHTDLLKTFYEKYEAELTEKLKEFNVDSADDKSKTGFIKIQKKILEGKIDVKKIPEEQRQKAFKASGLSEDDLSKKSDEEKNNIIREYQVSQYLEALKDTKDKGQTLTPELYKKEATRHLGYDAPDEKDLSLLDINNYAEALKKNPEIFAKILTEKGYTLSEIDTKSGLGNIMQKLSTENVREFFAESGSLKIDQNLRFLEEFPGLYKDILTDPNFPLSEDLEKSKQKILEVIRSGEIGECKTPEELEKNFKAATGLSTKDVKEVTQAAKNTGGRKNLSPLVKLLADLLAPFGLMFENSGLLKGDFWKQYMNELQGNSENNNNGDNEFSKVEMTGTTSGETFVQGASKYLGKPYVWGGEFDGNGGGDCSGLVVRTLRDTGCMGNARPTAGEFRKMSQEVGVQDGQVGDFLIRESGGGATHIMIIEKNNGDGTYETIEAKGKDYGTIRSHVSAGENLGVYKNPFLTENAAYAGKLRGGGSGREKGYETDFNPGRDYRPNPAEIAGVNVDLGPIQEWEGMDYAINYPGTANSGFTLGHGYDLQFYSSDTIASDWGKYLTPEQVNIIKSVTGKKYSKEGARSIQSKLNQLPGGFMDFKNRVNQHAGDILRDVTMPKFIAETKKIYPEIVYLEPKAQTALVSLVYNRGSGNISSGKRIEMHEIKQHLAAFESYKRNGREKEFYNKLSEKFIKMNQTRSDWPEGLKRRRREEAALIKQCGSFRTEDDIKNDEDKKKEIVAEGSSNPAVKWFRENAGKEYGSGAGRYDCMTSTHNALGLSGDELKASIYQSSNIIRDGKSSDLWNVSMAAAQYVGQILEGPKKDIQKDQITDLYGGERARYPENLEYYIEENVMKRVAENPMIDVLGNGKLMHYGKKNGIDAIEKDVLSKLGKDEIAMMGSTGKGTNIGGHEWLIAREGDKLMVYESSNHSSVQGVSGTGVELSTYLSSNRRAQYGNEAIIFAKK